MFVKTVGQPRLQSQLHAYMQFNLFCVPFFQPAQCRNICGDIQFKLFFCMVILHMIRKADMGKMIPERLPDHCDRFCLTVR